MADAVQDAPSTTSSTVPSEPSPALSDLTPAERQTWRKTGEKPARKTAEAKTDAPTPNAASSTAAPTDSAVSTETLSTPASEPGTPTREKQNKETRKAELDAEIQERLSRRRQLEQEVAEYETRLSKVKPAAETPPPTAPVATENFPEFDEWLALPGNETKGLGAYTQAAIAFDRERTRQTETVQTARQTRLDAFHAKLEVEHQKDPEFLKKIDPALIGLRAMDHLGPKDQADMSNVFAQELLEADQPYALLQYFTDHPAEWRGLLRETLPSKVIRHVAAVSARLSLPSAPSVPAVKTTTDAPEPPPSIGSRPASVPNDELLQAARSGDFRRYRDTANAMDIARAKAGGRR